MLHSLRTFFISTSIVALILRIDCTVTLAQASRDEDIPNRIERQHAELLSEFHSELAELAVDCREKGLKDAAKEILPWLKPVNAEELAKLPLPTQVQPEISAELSQAEKLWRIQLREARKELATELYLLSRRALNARQEGAALRLIHEVAWYDSDNERARKLLGYVRNDDEWVTDFTAYMLRKNREWHDRFGWLPKGHAEKYDNGERMYRNRWYSADREAELRRDFRNAWEVETDHYKVRTNVSLEAGVALAKALEGFHDWFKRSFPEFFTSPEQLKQLFSGSRRRRPLRKPFTVHYFRSKAEYVARLQSRNAQIAITQGIYMTDDRTAFFYLDRDNDAAATLYHEATHQILYELQAQPHPVGEREHFWIIEGLACYMESFRQQDGVPSIGDPNYVRFYMAKSRLVDDGFFVPLGSFCSMGQAEFQQSRSIRERYSQASGLVHFFMHYKDGRYRDALIQYIKAIYGPLPRPTARVSGMDRITGVGFDELGRQYRSYISELDSEFERFDTATQTE